MTSYIWGNERDAYICNAIAMGQTRKDLAVEFGVQENRIRVLELRHLKRLPGLRRTLEAKYSANSREQISLLVRDLCMHRKALYFLQHYDEIADKLFP